MTAPNGAPPSPPTQTVPGRHVPDADLKAYADGELGGWGRVRVRRHLAGCPACRQEIERMERLTQYLRASDAPVEPLNAALRARLIAAAATVPATSAPAETFVSSSPLGRRQPLLTLGASGAIAALAVYLVAFPQTASTLEGRGAAETARTPTSFAPAGASAGAGGPATFNGASPAVAAAAAPPAERAATRTANVEERSAAPRSFGYAAKVTAAPSPAAPRPPSFPAQANTMKPLRLAEAARDADGLEEAGGKNDGAVLRKNASLARRAAADLRAPLRGAASEAARPATPVPLTAAAPSAAAGITQSRLSTDPSSETRFALVPTPREIVVSVAPGQSAAAREAVVSLVRSAGGSFEERRGLAQETLGLDAAHRRLDVRVAPERVETLLADVARLNVQAVSLARAQQGRPATLAAATAAGSVADAAGGRAGVAKSAPAASAPTPNSGFGGGLRGGSGPFLGRGGQNNAAQNNAAQNQANAAPPRKEQQRAAAVPARAALTIRIVEETKAGAAAGAPAPNSAGQKAP